MAEFAMILDKNIKYETLKGLPCVKGSEAQSREQSDRGIVAAHWAAHAGRDSMCIFALVEQK